MSAHFRRALEQLKEKLLVLSAQVEESVFQAVRALEERDEQLAHTVIDGDYAIDQMEVDIEEECLKILALHQPVANDLRIIVAVLKINNDLERIGDISVNIAERAAFLATQPPVSVSLAFPVMAQKTQTMLKQSLDALVNMDTNLAGQVRAADDEVDAMNRDMYIQVQRGIRDKPEDMEALLHLLSISRHLERIADLATNIAEDVIYVVQGVIVRHRPETYEASADS